MLRNSLIIKKLRYFFAFFICYLCTFDIYPLTYTGSCKQTNFSQGQIAVMVSSMSGRHSNRSDAWANPNFEFDSYEPDNVLNSARKIPFHQQQAHSFHQSCDVDLVGFNVPVQGSYRMTTAAIAGKLPADTHLKLYLYTTNPETFTLVADNDNFNNTLFSEISSTLSAGNYLLVIENKQATNFSQITHYSLELVPCVDTRNYVINSNLEICLTNPNFTASINAPNAIGYIWSVEPFYAFIEPFTNNQAILNTVINIDGLQIKKDTEITLSVIPIYACGAGAPVSKVIKIGKPKKVTYLKRPYSFCRETGSGILAISPQVGETCTVNSNYLNLDYDAVSNTYRVTCPQTGNFPIEITVTNSCGTYTETIFVDVYECGCNVKVYPNPAVSDVQIDLDVLIESNNFSLQIFNSLGQAMPVDYNKNEENGKISRITLITKNLPEGIYYLLINGAINTDANKSISDKISCRLSRTLLIEKSVKH